MRFIRLSSSQETSLFLRCHLTNGAFSVHGQTPVSLCTSSQNNSKINRTRDRLNCLSFISKLVSLHPRAVKGKYGNVVLRRHINTVKSSHQVRPLKHSQIRYGQNRKRESFGKSSLPRSQHSQTVNATILFYLSTMSMQCQGEKIPPGYDCRKLSLSFLNKELQRILGIMQMNFS